MKRTRKSEAAETKVRIPQRQCRQWGWGEEQRLGPVGGGHSGSGLGERRIQRQTRVGPDTPLSLTALPIQSRSRTGRRHKPTISAQVKALFPSSLPP